MSALEFLPPSYHCKEAISSLLIELGEKVENFYVGPTRGKWGNN